jgi:hypothetical protein
MTKYDAAKFFGDGTVETVSGRKEKNGRYCKLTQNGRDEAESPPVTTAARVQNSQKRRIRHQVTPYCTGTKGLIKVSFCYP